MSCSPMDIDSSDSDHQKRTLDRSSSSGARSPKKSKLDSDSMGSIDDQLRQVFGGSDQQQKVTRYNDIAQNILNDLNRADAMAFVRHIVHEVGESGAVVVSRPVLKNFASKMEAIQDNDFLLDCCEASLTEVRPKAMYYAEEILSISDTLKEVLQADGDFVKAAKVLSACDIDSMRVDDQKKCEWHIHTAQLFLEGDDSVNAATFIRRAQRLLPRDTSAKENVHVVLRFRTAYARIMDSERRFIEAAMKYLQIAQMDTGGAISEGDIMVTLQNAITCTVLAKVGPARSRVLAMLFRDERTHNLPNFRILEKTFKDRFIREAEIKKFEATLQPHQQAEVGDGRTVLDKAMTEHNLLAASRIYTNIKFDQLAALLGVSEADAEKLAASMIKEKRLSGSIDQIDEIIHFETASNQFSVWDGHINNLCLRVNSVLEDISQFDETFAL